MRSVLITGATRNTGFSEARKFAKEGWTVFITSRNAESAEKAAAKITEEFGTPCYGLGFNMDDIHAAEAVIEFVKSKGIVLDSVVLNSAAQGLNTDPLTIDIEEWAAVIRTNVVVNFSLARAVAKEMVAAEKQGTIVFLGSVCYQDCNIGRSSYNTSKGGILSMTKSLAMDLGKYGIRVNCLMPGPIHTERYDVLDEDTRKWRDSCVPIGRVSTGDDIAGGVYFFASEQSGNATGAGLILDGGVDAKNSLGW